MFNVYTGILKMMNEFQDDGLDVSLKYLIDANYNNLLKAYNLHEITSKSAKTDLDKAINLLEWISSKIYHYGNYNNRIENSASRLFEYSLGKGMKNGLNCRSLSFALTECLLAVGIKARTVYIMPFSPYDGDNHVVCEAWSDSLNKWFMIDPTYNLYAIHEGVYLSTIEIRTKLANQEVIAFNEKANYNGKPINVDDITSYYAKNLFRFMVSDIQGSDSENIDGRRMIDITPIGYDVTRSALANVDFRVKENGECENTHEWRKSVLDNTAIYKGIDILYR